MSFGLHAVGHPLRPEGHSLGLHEGQQKQVTDCGTMLMIDGPFKYFSELKTPKYLISITRTESSGKHITFDSTWLAAKILDVQFESILVEFFHFKS